jgi:hypothetical protein
MSDTPPIRDEAAMADILASIRRIVKEEETRVTMTSAAPPGPQGEILELTEAMRVDAETAQEPVDAPPKVATLSPLHVEPLHTSEGATPNALAQSQAAPPSLLPTREGSDADSPAPAANPSPAQPAQTPSAPNASEIDVDLSDLPIDEAQVADIVRAVLREELRGDLGRAISRKIRDISREEIARAFEEFASEE